MDRGRSVWTRGRKKREKEGAKLFGLSRLVGGAEAATGEPRFAPIGPRSARARLKPPRHVRVQEQSPDVARVSTYSPFFVIISSSHSVACCLEHLNCSSRSVWPLFHVSSPTAYSETCASAIGMASFYIQPRLQESIYRF